MPAKQFTAFISYSHTDGEMQALQLQQKINIDTRGKTISFWQDHSQMKYGQWSRQIEDAINNVEFLIMLITPGALDSPNCKDEWMYARKNGVAVLPVNGKPDDPDFYNSFPNWLKKQHIYHPEKNWERFINDLNSRPETPKVPFMAPRLSEISNYVERKEKLSTLKQLLQQGNQPVTITTSLQGSGGFGKTTLAIALCNDDDIINAFDDGILWVTLGQQKGTALTAMQKLFDAINSDKQNFIDIEQAQQQLKEKLYGKNYLLVLDDVWHRVDVEAILKACTHTAVLITTRMDKLLLNSRQEDVDEMTDREAIQQLSSYTGGADVAEKLGKLAKKLGYWALLLKLAGAQLKARIDEGESIEKAIDYVSKKLARKGLSGFDRFDAEQRNDSVQLCLAASIELLAEPEKGKLYSLGIFSEYGNIPFGIIEKYWDLDEFDCEELLEKFHRLGIVDLDLTTRIVAIHDILLRYYNSCLENPPAQHALLMNRLGSFENWNHKYAWEWGISHLVQAGAEEIIVKLLSNYQWIEKKYNATGSIYEVTKDYDRITGNEELRLIQIALLLSAPAVTNDPAQLPHQLYGRLGSMKNALCSQVAMQAFNVISNKEFSLKPLHPNLEVPDLHNLVFRGHLADVTGALIQDDTLISWASDNTLRSWDIFSGKPKQIFEGHSDSITGALLQGNTLISWSYDKTIRSWDIFSGKPKQVFEGHLDYVNGVLWENDVLISWSFDYTLHSWDILSGKPKMTFSWGHSDRINGALLRGDVLISWSLDNTLCLWDILSGKVKQFFKGHSDHVTGALLKDGTLISWSRDKTLRSWDIFSGKTKQVFEGHTYSVYGALICDNVLLSWSADNSLRSWDINTGKLLQVFEGHLSFVTGALLHGDTLISWSRDYTIRSWDLNSGTQMQIFEGFASYVSGVLLQGDVLIGWSHDKAIRSWNIHSGLQKQVFDEHTDAVNGALLNSNTLISWSEDKTLRSRNLISDRPKQVVEGHSSFVTGALIEKDSLISWSSDKTLQSWDILSGKTRRVFEELRSPVSGVLLQNDILIGWSSGKALYSWDILSGKIKQVFDEHSESVIGALLQKDALFSWSYDKTICSWDVTLGKLEHVFKGHSAWINGAFIKNDILISWSSDKTLRSWNIQSGKARHVFEGHSDSVIGALIKDDILISWSLDKTLRSWNILSGEPLKIFDGHSLWVYGALLQGNILIGWSYDFTLRSWDIFSGKRLKVFTGHSSWVTGAISQGDIFVSWSNEELIIRNISSGKILLYFETSISTIKISGAFLYLNNGQNSLYIYRFPSLEYVCRFTVDAQITLLELAPQANRIIVGDASGRIHFIEPVGFIV